MPFEINRYSSSDGEKHYSNGFKISFKNGYTVSVQFGANNYCENREGVKTTSETAEIAVFDENNNFATDAFTTKGDGQVVGWLTSEEVLEVLDSVGRAI